MIKRDHPWPTNGITVKQLDKQTDRLDRRIDKIRTLLASVRLIVLENKRILDLLVIESYKDPESDEEPGSSIGGLPPIPPELGRVVPTEHSTYSAERSG